MKRAVLKTRVGMKPGGGKKKGSEFERMVCKRLSLWISAGQHDDWFWRSAMSGGRASVQFKKGRANATQVGDISAIDARGEALLQHVVVECKHVKSLALSSFLFKHTGILQKFWDKLEKESGRVGRQPLMIARENGFPTLFITTPRGVVNMKIKDYVAPLVTRHSDFGAIKFYLFDEIVGD